MDSYTLLVSNGTRRSRVEIVLDILRLAQNGKSRFKILAGAQLNSNQIRQYLDSLVSSGLLELKTSNQKSVYFTTQKGKQFLKQHESLRNLVNERSDHQDTRSTPSQRLGCTQ